MPSIGSSLPGFPPAAGRCWMWAPGMALALCASPVPRACGMSFCWNRAVSCVAAVPRRRRLGHAGRDLQSQQGSFDVVTCLWNVLGHILPSAARAEMLRQFARLVSAEGKIFIDLNHRYNARHYGAMATAARCLWDRVSPGEHNGDVRVSWDVGGGRVRRPGASLPIGSSSPYLRPPV